MTDTDTTALPADPAAAIGTAIRLAREQAGLTQTGLARQMGLAQASIGRMESGKTNPTVAIVVKYAEALGAPVEMKIGTITVTLTR